MASIQKHMLGFNLVIPILYIYLSIQEEHGLYAEARAGCQAGPYTGQAGYVGYNELCDRVSYIFFQILINIKIYQHLLRLYG